MITYEINIYTDGSYMSSLNRGGWGIYCELVKINNKNTEIIPTGGWGASSSKLVENPTNQRMELYGVIQAIIYYKIFKKEFHQESYEITCNICTDSAYIFNCYKEGWYKKWQTNGWLNSKNKPVANKDLWELIIPVFEKRDISIMKVQGHNNVKGNEIADLLATTAAEKDRLVSIEEFEDEDNNN